MSYYERNEPFLEPSIYAIQSDNDSKTVSEFPIIYYTVAQIWKITEKKVFIYRLINTFIVLLGLFFLFLLAFEILKDVFLAFLVPLFFFTSPLLVYYGNNFLMNAPALGFVLIAWYFFWKYYKSELNKHLIISMVLFLLAALLKITSMISFIALIAIYILDLLKFGFLKDIQIQKNKLPFFLSVSAVILIVVLWYRYAGNFNSKHLSGIFLQGIYPIWDLTRNEITSNAINLYTKFIPTFFNSTALGILILSCFWVLIKGKTNSRFLYLLSLFVFGGVIVYIFLWFKAFTVHDYYLTNLLILIPILTITILYELKKSNNEILTKKTFKIVSLIFLVFLAYNTAVINRIKYSQSDPFVKRAFIIDKPTIDYWKWYHWNYKNHYQALEELPQYYDSLGIKKSDTIISIPDESINVTLYLLDLKGFNDFGYVDLANYDEKITHFIELGAKYLILNDTNLLQNPDVSKYAQNLKFEYKNVKIYDLQ